MIFDTINDIIYYKKGNQLDNIDNEKEYSCYMVNRWLSMYSDSIAVLINETTNKFYNNFTTKTDHYKFLCKTLPLHRVKRIEYLKKEKIETKIDDKIITFLAKNLQTSKREIIDYIHIGCIDYKSIAIKLKQYEQKS